MARTQTWLEATKKFKEAQKVVSSQNIKPSFIPHPRPNNPIPVATPLKIQKLTWVEMVEFQHKGLCYNCDEKYFPEHKCKEQNIFMDISKDVFDEDINSPPVEELPHADDPTLPSDPPEGEPMISLNALIGFSVIQVDIGGHPLFQLAQNNFLTILVIYYF
jgi:hypothetical protein